MLRFFQILTISFLFSCNTAEKQTIPVQPSTSQTIKNKELAFDTLPNGQRLLNNLDSQFHLYYREVVGTDTLKGGYITCYGIDDSMRYFYLRHGENLTLLNKAPIYITAQSAGVLEKDLDSLFITSIDGGNGFPRTYQVFNKVTGKNIMGDDEVVNGYEIYGGELFLLYDNYPEKERADSVFLINTVTRKTQGFKLPEKENDYTYIELIKLSKNSLTISYREFIEREKYVSYKR